MSAAEPNWSVQVDFCKSLGWLIWPEKLTLPQGANVFHESFSKINADPDFQTSIFYQTSIAPKRANSARHAQKRNVFTRRVQQPDVQNVHFLLNFRGKSIKKPRIAHPYGRNHASTLQNPPIICASNNIQLQKVHGQVIPMREPAQRNNWGLIYYRYHKNP